MALQLNPDDPEAEQRVRRRIEKRAQDDIVAALEEQRRALIDPALQADDAVDWFRQDFEQAMSDLRFNRQMRDNLRQTLVNTADLGVRIAVRQLDNIGLGFDWTLANEAAREWATNYVGQLVSGIDDTTRTSLRRSVTEWIDNGRPLQDLIDEVTPLFGMDRAELIASTEVTRAYAEGNRQAYQASGVVTNWEWRTANDERVCPICGPLDGAQVNMGGSFDGFVPDEVRHQDGIDAPPAHPRCRCWVVPVVGAQ